ncbi:MAG: sensor histidine kinase [Nitrospirota bacterium]
MLVGVILTISTVLQVTAAALAFRLIRVTGWVTAWVCVASAISLMAVRRVITLYGLSRGEIPRPIDPVAETVALVISLLMVIGLYYVAPSFRGFKRSMEVLRDAEMYSENLIQTANVLVVRLDVDGCVRRLNHAGAELTGYTEAELRGQNWFDVIVPKSRYPLVWDEFHRILSGGTPKTFQNPIQTKSGEERFILWRNNEVRQGNAVVGTISFGLDITDRKRAEEALRESRRTFATLLSNLPGAVYRCRNDRDWTVEFMSDGALVLTGYPASDFIEKKIAYGTLIHPDDREPVWDDVQAALAKRQPFELVYRLRTAAGDERWVWERGQGVFADAGDLLFLEGFITDLTERKRAEDEIQRLNRDLEERVAQRTSELKAANAELESFSYSVSHDLRGPLRAINGFSQALLADYSDRLDEQGRAALRRVHAATNRMAELIEALLSLARIGRSDMERRPLDVSALARTVAADLQRAEPTRRVTVTIHDGLTAEADRRLMRIVLENLLGNAWKFTSKVPAATIEVGRTERDGAPVLFVRDNGAGFNMAYGQKLFGAFQRLHTREEFEGTGIGLATVQRIIHRHGGRIWAEAEVGKGATFFMAL